MAAAQSAEILAAHQHARQAAGSGRLETLAAQEAAEIEAIADRIIPADGTPGAKEAGVIYFIDRALGTFDREKIPAYRRGLEMAQARRRELFPASVSIAALTVDERQRLAAAIEHTDFFEMLRVHSVMGFLGSPEYGGNRNQAGWALIGFHP